MFFKGNRRLFCLMSPGTMQVTVVVLLSHENEFQGGLNHFEPGFDGGVAWRSGHFDRVSMGLHWLLNAIEFKCLKTSEDQSQQRLPLSGEPNGKAEERPCSDALSTDSTQQWQQ